MKISDTPIEGLKIIEPKIFEDSRGYFFESYNYNSFESFGIEDKFIQDNQSKSGYGVIRGLHYQLEPYAQTKLVRVLNGSIFDVAVDIRKGSATFGKWFGIELTCSNKLQLLVPKGFAHGFSVLSETATVLYKCDRFYMPSSERGINYKSSKLNIDWEIPESSEIVSARDKVFPDLETAEINFIYGEI